MNKRRSVAVCPCEGEINKQHCLVNVVRVRFTNECKAEDRLVQTNEVEGFSFSLPGVSRDMRTAPVDTVLQITINSKKAKSYDWNKQSTLTDQLKTQCNHFFPIH